MKSKGFGQKTQYWQNKGDTTQLYEPVFDDAEHGETLYPKIKVPPGVFDRLR